MQQAEWKSLVEDLKREVREALVQGAKMPEMLSLEDAARELSMGVKTLKRHIAAGRIMVNTELGRWKVPASEIRGFAERARSLAETPARTPTKPRIPARSAVKADADKVREALRKKR